MPSAAWRLIRTLPMAAIEKIASALLRAPWAASGGARNPHGRTCPLRLLRAGGHRPRRARYALKRFFPESGISLESRNGVAASGGARNPHGPAGTVRGRNGSSREALRCRDFGDFRPSEPEAWSTATARIDDRGKRRKRGVWGPRSRAIPTADGSLALRLLRAGGHRPRRARYALKRFFPEQRSAMFRDLPAAIDFMMPV